MLNCVTKNNKHGRQPCCRDTENSKLHRVCTWRIMSRTRARCSTVHAAKHHRAKELVAVCHQPPLTANAVANDSRDILHTPCGQPSFRKHTWIDRSICPSVVQIKAPVTHRPPHALASFSSSPGLFWARAAGRFMAPVVQHPPTSPTRPDLLPEWMCSLRVGRT